MGPMRWCLLTHWGWVMHICVSKLTITGSDNGLSPSRRQAIIWTNAGILWVWPLGTNFNEILILTFSFKKMRLKVSSAELWPFCVGLNVLSEYRPCWVLEAIRQTDGLLLKRYIDWLGGCCFWPIWVKKDVKPNYKCNHPQVWFCDSEKFVSTLFVI